MKFFKRKESLSDLPSSGNNKQYGATLKHSLEYFGSNGQLEEEIMNVHRYVINEAAKHASNGGLTPHDLDKNLNKELITKKVLQKYQLEDSHFALKEAEWFPRLRTVNINDETRSLDSYNSDLLSEDGFTETFSWETKSIQEMVFPSTPELEKKPFELQSLQMKNKSKEKKKKSRVSVGDTNDLRTYETIDQLRQRLLKNYKEAKLQREKYLNLKSEDKKEEEVTDKSVNGHRHKKKSQNIFKNYKQDSSQKNSSNSPTSELNDIAQSSSLPNSFSAEQISAMMKHSSTSGSNVSTLENVQTSNSEDSVSNTCDVKVILTAAKSPRRDSSKKKEGNSWNSISRKDSSEKQSSPLQSAPLENNEDDDDISQNDDGLDNIMDMLSNW